MDTLDLQVTVRNITVGQTITHPVVIVHTGLLATLPEDAATIDGLEILAESGEPSPFSRGVTVVPGVKSATVMADSGPIPAGEEATLTNVSAAAGDYISVIGMLACTNDAVTYGTVALSKWGSTPAMSSGAVLDAGTEDNSETAATVPCLGGESVSGADIDDGEGSVSLHPGIEGDASLVQETHGWDGPAMQIVVTGAGEEVARIAGLRSHDREPDGGPADNTASRRGSRSGGSGIRLQHPNPVGRHRRSVRGRSADRPAGDAQCDARRGSCVWTRQRRPYTAGRLLHCRRTQRNRGS